KGFKHEALFNTIQLKVKEKYSGLVERFNENVNDYNELLEENKSLKSKISDLKRDVSLIYESTKEFLKERTDGLKAFKNVFKDRKSTRLNSSHVSISYAVFCLKKKTS